MTKLTHSLFLACLSLVTVLGNACTLEAEDGFVAYGAIGGETGEMEDLELDDEAELCGDGILGDTEECDDGEANANNAACTASCTINECGDGLVFEGVEECDMGELNGENSSCDLDCSAK
jgi:cysteine-rich repeat protein